MGILKSFGFGILLLSRLLAQGQAPTVAQLQQQVITAQQQTLQEKVYVHTDKSTYVAGEIIWFNVYCVDAGAHTLLGVSKVAYVDVLDANHQFLVQAKVALQEGSGSGSLFLPVGAATGNYTLRAYTAWMKNFGGEQLFQKPITLINPLKEYVPAADTATKYNIRFFPEGGSLVAGLESTVALEVANSKGSEVAYTATIFSDSGDSITTTSSAKFGKSRFSFTPAAQHTYRAVVQLNNGKQFQQAVPAALEQGYVMHLLPGTSGALSVSVMSSAALIDRNVYLLAYNAKKVQAALVQPFTQGKATFSLDPAALAEGITYLTVFNEARQPVCERLYFKKPKAQPTLRLQTDQPTYTTRQNVNVAIAALSGDSTTPVKASLAVYKKDGLQDTTGASIISYLWLASELSGTVATPDFYFSNDAGIADATENLLLTQGWRRFKWEPSTAQTTAFPPEVNGHLIRTLISDPRTGKPVPNASTYLSIPGTPYQFYTALTDSNGIALFNVKNLFGPSELILQANTVSDSAFRVEVLPVAAPISAATALPAFTFSNAHTQALLQQSISMQVQNIYRSDSLMKFQVPQAYDTVPFYGRPDYSYLLDVYTRFQTMEEVLREYVRPINVAQRRGALHLLIMDEARRQFFDGGELVLLDGIPLFKKDAIFTYDPLKVKKLDVVTHKYFVGPLFFNGVASFTTYNGNYEGLQLDPRALVIDYEGLQLQREFYAPVYETDAQKRSRVPDFRSTLLWKPNLQINGKTTLQFYTSDVKGAYTIVVEGLDKNGRLFATHLPIDVR